jgi:DNA-binding LacI/PurR family transcriptional regulator/signal transduction histidine kinase/ActR/RegA family two-component response regulator
MQGQRPGPKTPPARQRKTVALLLDYMTFTSGAYEALVRKAFHGKAVEHDVDLLMLYGRSLNDADPEARAHNAIFELLSSRHIDAAIVVATSLSAKCGSAGLERFIRRLAPIPVCSIGVQVPDVPNVTIDNYTPMRSLVGHLIEVHQKRRIAFIAGTSGNREADARFAGYRDTLSKYGLEFDERLFACGQFLTWTGRTAMQEIIDRTRDFDAVVAANDGMAVGAIETLWKNGIHVPRDVAVTGFDDLLWARFGNPPLTTVEQPIDAIATHTFEIALDLIAGNPRPLNLNLPTEVVLRRSCGCGRQHNTRENSSAATEPGEYLSQHLADVEEKLRDKLQHDGLGQSFAVSELVRPLLSELSGVRGAFMGALDDLLVPLSSDIERCRACQEAIVYLRDWMRPVATREVDDLLFEGFERVAASLAGTQVGHQLDTDNRYLELLNVAERVSVALDEPSLRAALALALPALGVHTAFVSLLSGPHAAHLRPLICLLDGEVKDIREPYDADRWIPESGYPPGRRHTLAIFPLTLDSELQGIAAFGYEREAHGYSTVRDNMCAALRSIRMHEELVARTRLHERSIQEKQATAKRMQALSVLAGGVAHDLNNALGPLVALPELILQQLEGAPRAEVLARSRQDLQTIQTAAQRAVQTIRDLLTLGRQGRVQKEPLDLGRTVASAVLHGGSAVNGNPQARVAMEAAREPLPILGSEAHLVRAISNLVQNALESKPGSPVVVRTARRSLDEPLHSYETIDPGDWGVVTVSDEGAGISEEQLPRIFEPFFSTKKLGERSGSGLGLAIVHGVVKEHGGFVDVTSSAATGTTFSLYFPLVAVAEARQTPSPSSPGGSARVLVLDDDPVQRRTAERILDHLGYRVEIASTGAEAYDLCMERAHSGKPPYDLLVLDVVLNEPTDGVEWYEHIRSRIPEQRALLVSGHMPSSRVERAVQNGLGWLAKPYTAQALAASVARTLGSHEPVESATD